MSGESGRFIGMPDLIKLVAVVVLVNLVAEAFIAIF